MKKYLFLLITLLFLAPNVVDAATDISQKDFDLAKKEGEHNGIAFDNQYNVYWFKTDGEYRLISDVTLTNQIVSNEADPELIIDLNGKTLHYEALDGDMSWFLSIYASKFTIKGTGKITSTSKMKYILIGSEGSDITLDGCTIEGRIGLDGEEKPEILTIKSGNFGSLAAVKANITIDDAYFNSDFLERDAIYVAEDVNLIINGGTFESKYGALKSLTSPDKYDTSIITINNGTFIGKENYGLLLNGHEKLEINNGIFKDDNNIITITKDDKSNLKKLISAGTVTSTIKVLDGDNSKYKVGTDKDLSFVIDKEYDVFVYQDVIYGSVYVDNKKIEESNFTFSDNTKLTLKNEYLKKLSLGKHSLVIESGYGDYASITFNVVNSNANILLYILILSISIIGILIISIYLKRKQKNNISYHLNN